jgi:hypothetical protein
LLVTKETETDVNLGVNIIYELKLVVVYRDRSRYLLRVNLTVLAS